jgi:ABC-type antimicrobial peptide transport system permease subunit
LAIEPGALVVTFLGAVLVGAPGALLPLRRVLRLDPATAFRTTS